MRISARDTFWCQYVYQFAHELCHLMINSDRHTAHRHRWFEECLCELASLFVLHRLSVTWIDDPPPGVAEATRFAPELVKYAEYVAARYSAPDAPPQWLADNSATLEAAGCARALTGAVAVLLLRAFLDHPALWRDCARLNLWDAAANRTFADYLDSWAASLRENGLEPRVPSLLAQLFFPARRVSSCPHPRRDDESPHYQSAGLRSPQFACASGPARAPAQFAGDPLTRRA